eukprot:COSAG03_NODE_111_length_12507_cov_28.124355_7_plen_78_part_00
MSAAAKIRSSSSARVPVSAFGARYVWCCAGMAGNSMYILYLVCNRYVDPIRLLPCTGVRGYMLVRNVGVWGPPFVLP